MQVQNGVVSCVRATGRAPAPHTAADVPQIVQSARRALFACDFGLATLQGKTQPTLFGRALHLLLRVLLPLLPLLLPDAAGVDDVPPSPTGTETPARTQLHTAMAP